MTFTIMMCRSCVAPKLVSNGCRRRIRSSRSSICLMNTRRSWNKQICAPFVVPLKAGDEIVLTEIFQELLSNAKLQVSNRTRALAAEFLNIRGNVYAADIPLRTQTWLIQPPFRKHAIRLERCIRPIEFDLIATDDDTEFIEIHVSIFCLNRIERPLDQLYAVSERGGALLELQFRADTRITPVSRDGQHMRVPVGFAVADTRHAVDEADEPVAFEGSEDQAAHNRLDGVHTRRLKVDIRRPECLALQFHAFFKFRKGGEGSDDHVGMFSDLAFCH